jgi:phosphatidylglycerol:prolipoprotein diacylglycerol transferase
MFPELFTVGPVVIHTYGLLVALGILAGVILGEHLNRQSGGEPGRIVDMSVIVVLAGLAGARIIFVLDNWGYYAQDPVEILKFWQGGLVFYGGLAGGTAAFILVIRHYRLYLWDMLDIGAAAVALGHAFGRLGCFSAGCCYGRPSTLPWSITFTDPHCLAVEVLNTPVHPTQLYSFLFLTTLAAFLAYLHPRRRFPGQMAAVYLLSYGIFRFAVEFLRGDPRGSLEAAGITLSVSQWASLTATAAGVFIYFFLSRKPRKAGNIEDGSR